LPRLPVEFGVSRDIPVQNKDLVQFLEKDLDRGESEVIVLAKELKADVVIIDENIGYQIAKRFYCDFNLTYHLSCVQFVNRLHLNAYNFTPYTPNTVCSPQGIICNPPCGAMYLAKNILLFFLSPI
jgi:hypothetical protein